MVNCRVLILMMLGCVAALSGFAQQPITWTPSAVVLESEPSSWTRMVQLRDGSWLAAYTVYGPARIRFKRSFDKMRTWQLTTEVAEPGRDLDNPTLCVQPDGTLLMAMRSVITGQSYFIETYRSTDNGNSFQYQSQVDYDHLSGGVYEPYLYVLPDGRILCFYTSEIHQHETPSYSQILAEKVSTDGGFTWGPEIFAISQPGAARPGEANIVALPGPVYALFYEICGTESCVGHVSYSVDGTTWPGIGPALDHTFQDVQAVGLQSGLIVATSNLKDVILSVDYTNTWIDTRFHPFAYGQWPAVYQTAPDEVAFELTQAGDHGEDGQYIRFGTINAAAIQAAVSVNPCKRPTATRPQSCY